MNMAKNFKEAVKHRRSYYNITNSSPISDNEIKEIIDFAVTNVPSAFNSQSTRIVLLLGENHKKFWDITKEALRVIVPAEAFEKTLAKINTSFDCGYGTILFWWRIYRKHFQATKITSLFGRNRHLQCISSLYGQC